MIRSKYDSLTVHDSRTINFSIRTFTIGSFKNDSFRIWLSCSWKIHDSRTLNLSIRILIIGSFQNDLCKKWLGRSRTIRSKYNSVVRERFTILKSSLLQFVLQTIHSTYDSRLMNDSWFSNYQFFYLDFYYRIIRERFVQKTTQSFANDSLKKTTQPLANDSFKRQLSRSRTIRSKYDSVVRERFKILESSSYLLTIFIIIIELNWTVHEQFI